jgi:predicted GH43/DUF377 family glycosyl hydrolase
VCGILFNHSSDFDPNHPQYVKLGQMFKDEDVMGSYAPDTAWNKSAVLVQFEDSHGKLRQVTYWNEGNHKHGGIYGTELNENFGSTWPVESPLKPHQKPVISVRKGEYDQNLVEVAQVIVAPLSPELSKKTGKKNGIYVLVHGDSPNLGYRVGYHIFDIDHPTGKPIYSSKGTFLTAHTPEERLDGQVLRVAFLPSFVVLKNGKVLMFSGAGDKWIMVSESEMAKTPADTIKKAVPLPGPR